MISSYRRVHLPLSSSTRAGSTILSGILFNFFVGSHPPPDALRLVLLNKSNEMAVTVEEIRKIPFLNDAMMELSRAINARKKTK